jgi:site-specific recombinase XerD
MKLMKVCFSHRTPAGFRDAALIAILCGASLRRAEVVKLDLKNFNNDGEKRLAGVPPLWQLRGK